MTKSLSCPTNAALAAERVSIWNGVHTPLSRALRDRGAALVTTSWVIVTFGDGVPKVFVIRVVMLHSHVLGYRSNNFFSSMA
jgi:hypothetical protein